MKLEYPRELFLASCSAAGGSYVLTTSLAYVECSYMHSRPGLDIRFVTYSIVRNPWSSLIPLSRGSFDVLVGMDQLSKRKFGIVCHGKVVRIPLEGDEILRVHGERTQGFMKTLMNTKVGESKLRDLVPGATPVAKSPYRLVSLEMQELSEQLRELQDKEKGRVKLRRVRAMSMTIQSSVKNKILTTPSETSKVENAPAEMLRDMDQQIENRADDGKANVVTDALSRKERVKPRRVRAMAMTIQYGVRGMILAAQSEAFKQENVLAERLHGLDQQMERKGDESLYFMDRIWVLLVGSVMDEAHASSLRYLSENEIESPWILSLNFQGQSNNSKEWNSGDDQLRLRWMIYLVVLADAAESVRDAIGFEYCLASSSGWTKSPVLWAEIGESSLTGLELVQETTDKVVLVKEKPKAARDRQKSYVDYRRKPLEFEVGDRVLLKVTPWKGVVRFGKKVSAGAILPVWPLNEIRWITCGYPWPELEGKRFGMIQERYGSSAWCLRDRMVRLNAPVRNIRTDNGTEFVKQTPRSYYESVGISHETTVARSLQQNGVVERQNCTLVEAARTMLIYAKAPLFLWDSQSLTVMLHQNDPFYRASPWKKLPDELLHDRKPDLSYLHVFGALCYPNNDSEDLGKLQAKADIGIFIGYAPKR
ncbi:putative reverse transcriptase domain-containing protein [Tanacetum coccineum]